MPRLATSEGVGTNEEAGTNSPTVGTFQSELRLTSSQGGTFTVNEQLRFTATDVLGTWQIKAGTGAYANASGHGTFQFISTLHFIDSGVASTG